MTDSFSVLVVCVGNVCRSPLAERLLWLRFAQAGATRTMSVASAGTEADAGRPIDPQAASELVRLGGDAYDFEARVLSSADVEGADLVLTATREVRAETVHLAPRRLHQVFTLRELATILDSPAYAGVDGSAGSPQEVVRRASAARGGVAVPDYDVPDPIGRSSGTHRTAADQIDAACATIADALVASLRVG